ncbi:hypothetical protein HDU91_004497, partial [Kappamyces sp. JEL0680]
GQRSRLALARAVYHDSDIYLLDDPLASLDASVGKQVYDDAIRGALKEKTVLMVTHQLHLMQQVDKVLVMDQGRIAEFGTFAELMAANGMFTKLMENYHVEDEEAETEKTEKSAKLAEKAQDSANALHEEEERATGSVKSSIYKIYLEALGGWTKPSLILLLAVLTTAAEIGSILWLAHCAKPQNNVSTSTFVTYYSLLGVSFSAFQGIAFIACFFMSLNAARWLHNRALEGLLRAPVAWLDSQPIGRVIARFSADVFSVDNAVSQIIINLIMMLASIFTSVFVVAQAN